MKLLDFFSGRNRQLDSQYQREQRSPRSDPNHPEHFKRYWTKQNVDWSNVINIRVDDTRVYVAREDGEELIATRHDHRTARGYASAVSTNRNNLPILDCL